ncbi:MAG: hypothetical protein HKO95_08915 [Rhodobacteraceae bacterium]|nr:hypothetical protein [Paracoccaceae bacterium]
MAQKQASQPGGMPICLIAWQNRWTSPMSMSKVSGQNTGQEMVMDAVSDAYGKEDPMHLFVAEYEPFSSGVAAKAKKAGVKII